MANPIGRLKSKEPSDSPIHANRENTPLRENQQLEYLPPTAFSRMNSPGKYATGSVGNSGPSTRTQSTSSPRDRYPTKDKFRQVTRDLLDQSSAHRSQERDDRFDPPKFDPEILEGIEFQHPLRDR